MELPKAARGAIAHIVAAGVQAVSGRLSMALFPGLPRTCEKGASSHAEHLLMSEEPVSPECRKQHATAEQWCRGAFVHAVPEPRGQESSGL